MVGMELRQQLKLTQQLVMTPQLQQAIKLLQLSRLELVDMVQQELEENPVLEESAEPAEKPPTDGNGETAAHGCREAGPSQWASEGSPPRREGSPSGRRHRG